MNSHLRLAIDADGSLWAAEGCRPIGRTAASDAFEAAMSFPLDGPLSVVSSPRAYWLLDLLAVRGASVSWELHHEAEASEAVRALSASADPGRPPVLVPVCELVRDAAINAAFASGLCHFQADRPHPVDRVYAYIDPGSLPEERSMALGAILDPRLYLHPSRPGRASRVFARYGLSPAGMEAARVSHDLPTPACALFRSARRLSKPGGELAFSKWFASLLWRYWLGMLPRQQPFDPDVFFKDALGASQFRQAVESGRSGGRP